MGKGGLRSAGCGMARGERVDWGCKLWPKALASPEHARAVA